MKFLGLDLSTTATGLVCVDSRQLAVHPPWEVDRSLLLSPKSKVVEERIDEIMRGILANLECDLVVIEAVAGSGIQRSNSLIPIAKLHGVVEYQLRLLRMPYMTVAPATWRKALLGKGNVKKIQVPMEVYRRYGFEHDSIDVVEAWCVAVFACRQRQGLLEPSPKRQLLKGPISTAVRPAKESTRIRRSS